tara:strand:- start:3 stop:545 length:543 start_codon:yes stop_codon:yes gene_type:complete
MKPRYTTASNDVYDMLAKAQNLLQKAEKLQKADMSEKDKYCMDKFGKKYSECSEKQKAQCDKAHDKVEKGKGMCPSCGGKIVKGGCMMKDGTMKMGCGGMKADMKKGEHHKETMFDTRPGGVQFVSESGGKTFNAQYQTNQSLLDADDVANKGSSSSSIDMQAESSLRNPHDNINRLVEG